MLTVMIDLGDLQRRKDMRESVILIDDGKIARIPVTLTVVHPQTR
jgi:hypothetical protein